MKRILVLAIALSSLTAFAQTETTAPATTTEATHTETATAPAAKAKAKKAKASKKKSAKPSAQNAPAVQKATEQVAAVVPAAAHNEATMNNSSATAPAAGTSTTAAAQPAADAKKWSATFVTQAVAPNLVVQRPINEVSIETINYVGAGYKVTADTKVGVRQYFSYNFQPNEVAKGNSQWTAATVGTKFKGIAGSDDIAPLFWYYMPTETALKNVYNTEAGAIEHHNGVLRLDTAVVWTINPKWQVSYYLNPRQSLVKKQSYQDLGGDTKTIEATTTLIHYGYVYYNFNDNIQAYGFGGMDSRATTADLRSIKDHALLGVGAVFNMAGGKFMLNPEIGNEVALKDGGEYAAAPRWLQSEDISYQLTGVVAF